MQEKIDAINAMIRDIQDALRAVRSEPSNLSRTAHAYFDLLDSEIACLIGDVERLAAMLPAQPQQEQQP